MPTVRVPLASTSLLLVAGFFVPASLGLAGDKPACPPGYHLVPVKTGDGTAYIEVRDPLTGQPGSHEQGTPDSDHPDEYNFNATSSYANKAYHFDDAGASANSGSYQKEIQRSFVTKSYFAGHADDADKTVAGWNKKVPLSAFGGADRQADGADRKFLTASDEDRNKTASFTTMTSSDQNKAAVLGGHDIRTYANAMASKSYDGPETRTVKQDLDRMNNGLESLKDLPDRPLTVDEVRALINHGVKPDLDQKPAPASKPLNDPDYQPDPAPAPLPADYHPDLGDSDGVPAPGTMAHPEDAEPLPR